MYDPTGHFHLPRYIVLSKRGKYMKKFILVIILMVSIFLTGCVSDPETYYFAAADLIANTIKIELVECKNEKLEMIEVNEKSITNFDYNEVEPIDNLDNSQFESFIIELSSITFHKRNYSANKPIGKTLVLHQKNGDMIVLSCTLVDGRGYGFASKFDSNCNYITHIAYFADRPKFESLLNEYFVFL